MERDGRKTSLLVSNQMAIPKAFPLENDEMEATGTSNRYALAIDVDSIPAGFTRIGRLLLIHFQRPCVVAFERFLGGVQQDFESLVNDGSSLNGDIGVLLLEDLPRQLQ